MASPLAGVREALSMLPERAEPEAAAMSDEDAEKAALELGNLVAQTVKEEAAKKAKEAAESK